LESRLSRAPIFDNCINHLRERLVLVAGADTWAAGFVEAVFRTGAHANLLADRRRPDHRLQELWRSVVIPPSLRSWIGYFDGSA
jgi:hypothetical protein